MTTEKQFNCVFCKETFSNKEDLQIHFRKHGDPSFKSGTPNDSPNGSEKTTEENEMVGCDVCEEVFPTISKAITHKHKVHPDHDAKYFCPFCGKLFTMKHLYNKHIQTNHDSQLSVEKSDFHCDSCEVMFFVPSAMLYHNKFFHRQDSELPATGGSKKVKLYSKEMIQLFYCAFCGEEYNNKVNLHKHVSDDHSDENQSPDEVLKCPLCEAIFHHLDAYELHLMFHSTEDEYSERNEMADEVTEFSLETVPPIMEKVENESSQDNTADEAVDVDNFLQLMMGDSGDGGGEKKKSKKHKKHKKSKKAAISLDEFLNMNKDVFGDGLDVQGIEEVPSRVMLKKMQVKKCPPNKAKALNADINKLQKIGITVKTKSGSNFRPTVNRCITNQPAQRNVVDKSKVNDPKELISKLMRQGNSQIKIVKKTASQNTLEDESEKYDMSETIAELKDEDNSIVNSNQNSEKTCQDDMSAENGKYDKEDDNDERKCKTPNNDQGNESVEKEEIKEPGVERQNEIEPEIQNSTIDEKLSSSVSPPNISTVTDEPSELHDDTKEDNVSDTCASDEECSDSNDHSETNSSNKAIGALKHLSNLVIKPIKSAKTLQVNKNGKKVTNTIAETKNACSNPTKTSEVSSNNVFEQQNMSVQNKMTEVLKNLGKNVTIKSATSNIDKLDSEAKESECEEEHEHNNSLNKMQLNQQRPTIVSMAEGNKVNNLPLKQLSAAKNGNENSTNASNNKPEVKIEKPVQKKAIDDEIEIFNIDDSDSDDAAKVQKPKNNIEIPKKKEPQQSNTLVHNLGSNITIKAATHRTEVKRKLDSNAYTNQPKKVNKPTPEIQKSINIQNKLKNLGSHITIKSNSTSTYSNEEHNSFDEDEAHSDNFDSDSDTEVGKVKITEVTEETSDVDEAANGECNAVAVVRSPEAQDNDSDHFSNEEDFDFESKIKTNVLNASDKQTPKSKFPDNIKCLNKDLVIKTVNQKNNPDDMALTPYENKSSMPSKTAAQTSGSSSQVNTVNRNVNTSDEVNTVKTVKKYQTETVIEEITTVTRTIRTFNESSNSVVQTSNQNCGTPLKINRNQPNRAPQQVKVTRHTAPGVMRMRTAGNVIRQSSPGNIRIPNQIVPIRNAPSQVRQMNPIQRHQLSPGMQVIRKVGPATNSQQRPTPNKLKMSPNVVKQLNAKRPSEANIVSNVKKYKESTMSMATQKSNTPMEQFTASTSRSEFSSVTKVMQGGKAMMATQTRSEVNTQQQLSRLSNMSGLKVMKTSTKQATQVEEKSEISASKRNTLEGIEKLQKLGLLVKKPRIDVEETNEQNFYSESDEENNCEQ
ncbi:putative leucine-rich repeat-containing protein DDB_G0290503 [Aricia agestis]|uniref:putative leucine-rich repeat-containing protein DDB_G0290503 n=1 Tax=Aricia agestis TaxID=91739 RepID=UPI001C207D48|nr:putative leucine-rich repeat-containing protein DDB_G0290503 [Aricia agestis]